MKKYESLSFYYEIIIIYAIFLVSFLIGISCFNSYKISFRYLHQSPISLQVDL